MESTCNIKSHPWLQEAGKFSSIEVNVERSWRWGDDCEMKMLVCPCPISASLCQFLLVPVCPGLSHIANCASRTLGSELRWEVLVPMMELFLATLGTPGPDVGGRIGT